ncbi:MAG: glycosyltransferase [Opitutae bacterium]
MNPKVSILISVRDQIELTRKCIGCLEQTLGNSRSYEVLMANDGSEDGTAKYLDSLSPPYRIFHRECSHGFAKNNNWLAREARGEYLLFLNNDAFVRGDWLNPMVEILENKSKVGFVGNVQKRYGTKRYDHMGVVFSPLGNPRHYGQGFFHRSFKGQVRKWSAVTAACCLIRKDLFWDCGGFDEEFVNGCEDMDLCIRLNRKGYSHYVAHDSVIDHVKGATTGRKDRNEENFELLMKKWGNEIRKHESVQDCYLHARTYLFRPLFKPLGTNLIKYLDAFLILTRIRKLSLI